MPELCTIHTALLLKAVAVSDSRGLADVDSIKWNFDKLCANAELASSSKDNLSLALEASGVYVERSRYDRRWYTLTKLGAQQLSAFDAYHKAMS
jgi:hypothetical protein